MELAQGPFLAPLPADLFAAAHMLSCQFRPKETGDFDLPLPAALHKAVVKRQSEYLAGRWCVAELYRQQGLVLPLPEYQEQGPPGWPAGWTGSISHSQNRAAAAIAPLSQVRALGLDLEFCMNSQMAGRVRDSILHPEEWPLLATDSLQNLTLIFSFKESLYKALNPLLKRFIGFQEVAVQRIGPQVITFAPRGNLQQDFPVGAPRQGRWLQSEDLIATAYEWLA